MRSKYVHLLLLLIHSLASGVNTLSIMPSHVARRASMQCRGSTSDEEQQQSLRLRIDPKRFVAYNLLAIGLALGANFLGVTSILTSINPEPFRAARLDRLYSIGGFSRCVDDKVGFEYLYPSDWSVDDQLLYKQLRDAETPEYIRSKKKDGTISAVYSPRNRRLENISVIKSPIQPPFSLRETLGDPEAAARRLLGSSLAAPGSGKSYELLSAKEVVHAGTPYYVFEYTLRKESTGLFQHTISVIASKKDDELITFTAQQPQADFVADNGRALRAAGGSFRIL